MSTRIHPITLIPGDGIGPEVSAAMVGIVEAAGKLTGASFDWHTFECGAEAYAKNGEILPQAALDSIAANKVAIKGPTATPIGTGFSSINVAMRKKFDLYANFRPVKSLPGHKDQLPRHRPHHLPRKHRRPLRRARTDDQPQTSRSRSRSSRARARRASRSRRSSTPASMDARRSTPSTRPTS